MTILYLVIISSFVGDRLDFIKSVDTEDTLRKYTYRFNGSDINPTGTDGTGFFYKHDRRLFLITANHVLCGCSVGENGMQKDSSYPVFFQSFKYENEGGTFALYLDTKSMWDTCQCRGLFERPDIIVVPIPDTQARSIWNKVYSVENFKIVDIVDAGEVKIVGYPSDSNYRGGRRNVLPLPGILSWKSTEYYVLLKHQINTVYKSFKRSIPPDSSLKGYSGSPVFFRGSQSDNWGLVGVFSGTINLNSEKGRAVRVPKFTYAIDQIMASK